jgi:uncharacterized protein YndB with AHSA1/START domain
MAKIDVTDETIIDGPPSVVYNAFLNELFGVTKWWMPHIRFNPVGSIAKEGSVCDATINPESKTSLRCSVKVTKLVEDNLIELEYAGDFVGTGVYIFEPKGGKTVTKFRFIVRPKKLLFRLIAPFVDTAKAHSQVMQLGFKACNNYLAQKSGRR